MVDKIARKVTLDVLSSIETDKLTNWQIEDKWPTSKKDPAINGILRWLWTLYDDNIEYVLIDKLTDKEKIILNRCRDFLKTEIDFPTQKRGVFERLKFKLKWGVEWRSDLTFPTDDYWPFPPPSGAIESQR